MARGSSSKEIVFKTIAEAFGDAWVGIVDNKGYVQMKENGETLQIAIALTCPKNMVSVGTVEAKPLDFGGSGFDFENMGATTAPKVEVATEISQQEQDDLAALLTKFGL
jgi:hypothetical protein